MSKKNLYFIATGYVNGTGKTNRLVIKSQMTKREANKELLNMYNMSYYGERAKCYRWSRATEQSKKFGTGAFGAIEANKMGAVAVYIKNTMYYAIFPDDPKLIQNLQKKAQEHEKEFSYRIEKRKVDDASKAGAVMRSCLTLDEAYDILLQMFNKSYRCQRNAAKSWEIASQWSRRGISGVFRMDFCKGIGAVRAYAKGNTLYGIFKTDGNPLPVNETIEETSAPDNAEIKPVEEPKSEETPLEKAEEMEEAVVMEEVEETEEAAPQDEDPQSPQLGKILDETTKLCGTLWAELVKNVDGKICGNEEMRWYGHLSNLLKTTCYMAGQLNGNATRRIGIYKAKQRKAELKAQAEAEAQAKALAETEAQKKAQEKLKKKTQIKGIINATPAKAEEISRKVLEENPEKIDLKIFNKRFHLRATLGSCTIENAGYVCEVEKPDYMLLANRARFPFPSKRKMDFTLVVTKDMQVGILAKDSKDDSHEMTYIADYEPISQSSVTIL